MHTLVNPNVSRGWRGRGGAGRARSRRPARARYNTNTNSLIETYIKLQFSPARPTSPLASMSIVQILSLCT